VCPCTPSHDTNAILIPLLPTTDQDDGCHLLPRHDIDAIGALFRRTESCRGGKKKKSSPATGTCSEANARWRTPRQGFVHCIVRVWKMGSPKPGSTMLFQFLSSLCLVPCSHTGHRHTLRLRRRYASLSIADTVASRTDFLRFEPIGSKGLAEWSPINFVKRSTLNLSQERRP